MPRDIPEPLVLSVEERVFTFTAGMEVELCHGRRPTVGTFLGLEMLYVSSLTITPLSTFISPVSS